jgi:hypothetical protein
VIVYVYGDSAAREHCCEVWWVGNGRVEFVNCMTVLPV